VSKAWKPTVAGLLNVISGIFFVIGGITILSLLSQPRAAVPWASYASYSMGLEGEPSSSFVTIFIITLGTAALILGMVSTLGGICSIKRRLWGIALAGSISTFIYLLVFGIPAIIFTVMSKEEFSQ